MGKRKPFSHCGIGDCLSHHPAEKAHEQAEQAETGTVESSLDMAKALRELLGNETACPIGLLLN